MTDDFGEDVAWDTRDHDQVYAAGPEVLVLIPPPVMMFVSLRTEWEFGVEDGPEGNTTVLTLTKAF